MANYFVGDIQGCFDELIQLLSKVDFNPSRDQLWAVGDLVARGAGSLPTLRYFKQLDGSANVSLGNHDLHLMAVHAKIKRVNPKDKLEALLAAPDITSLIGWLRHQPLHQELPEHKIIMSHAGVPPQWDLSTLRAESQLVTQALLSTNYEKSLIQKMYTSGSNLWHLGMDDLERKIYCINALTRMRFLHSDGRLDFECKLSPAECKDPDLTPWFIQEGKINKTHTLVFGHWAAVMGEVDSPTIKALDTGCCWGEYLSLWHLETDEIITQNKLKKS
ncbi:symmetrical bis(5'-nucleosyl)-tetraphosphatase [Shewanella sp. D64]|uniref:symmetrical bis(5'-nucleosyl)-tetraphosphatase n=1 Tax=unclassified Shewanella TaxID=196818 RepID=UPI0022BA4384|nr:MULTISPECIES: symmetrical bis(5'-nucleosyl)-tetraphosphatase [unclassified Shewanella]MEC4727269.1 symmetrical bis(5'-nucleosyl)-tetraphosphatase [Shewanella sp. D64]MEC4739424.1 symmetrical bis(5'-nucleosyl)-tetraphosphatase [Shewanella sp. E94]WBJ96753.1 symmetrical bis(5'-nucleosyl)-tetraphosphatase [Shewanella sp. MTB7]